MKDKFFVIGDIHGELEMMREILEFWREDVEQLVFLGDLCDRGENAKRCFLLAKKLVEEKQAIYLLGNHERMFLNFIEDPESEFSRLVYFENGGRETLESFFFKGVMEEYSLTELAMMLRSQYGELIQFLKERPLYFEWEQYIFVHAGVNLRVSDWRESTEKDYLWTRKDFIADKNNTGKIIVFGHTITAYLNGDTKNIDIWQEDGKIGIDGGAVFGFVLYGVTFTKEGIETIHSVENPKKRL
ncbi:serine/threonine protein phosphatase 1 [Pilibacter termitis]|uniref:Serine/threonine protein phosphatase 1 n=1 Tax=Pilibacter termitis TaxID=263852 RepID=A0A1T4PZS2_9ENTE|nr:metallophosphoesterase [Pilibacter termitis]SJZ97005.1 serine/threonine protein phosphatase 1 [Pilibacter termitis]